MGMSSSLKDKVIAISGAGSGLGLAAAKYLYSLGARLSLTDIREEALAAAISELAGSDAHQSAFLKNETIYSTTTDTRSSEQVNAWINGTVSHFGALDGAANLAGVTGPNIGRATVSQLTDEEWHFVTDVNLHGVFYSLRAQLQAMEKLGTKGGSIVNPASTSGIEGQPFNANYATAKHGVVGLTRSAAKEVGRLGIRVNAIAPGVIDTPMVRNLPPPLGGDGTEEYIKNSNQVLGRLGQPGEIAKLIAFLLSDDSSFTTGAVYVADGGQVC